MPLSEELLQKIRSNEFDGNELDFYDYPLDDADIAHLHEALLTNTTIKSIIFNSNSTFSTNSLKLLLSLNQITSLNLRGIDTIDLEAIELLAQSEHLIKLNLNANRHGDDVPKIFAACESKIKHLSLTHCGISPEGAQALATLSNLESLNLLWNNLSDDGVIALAQHPKITDLNLIMNKISSRGVLALGQMHQLENLTLAANSIGDSGLKELAQLPRLESLDLSNCLISDAGAEILARFSQVFELNLSQNRISDAGAACLAKNPCLKKLDLSKNFLRNSSVAVFMENTCILDLDLSFNERIDEQAFEVFLENRVLHRLGFWHPSDDMCEQIRSRLEQNVVEWKQWLADIFEMTSVYVGPDLALEAISYIETTVKNPEFKKELFRQP